MSILPQDTPDLSDLVAQSLDDAGDLFDVHVAVARAEVARDLRRAGRAILTLLAGGAVASLGGLLLHVAVADTLFPWLGVGGVAATLGLFDVTVGGLGLALGTASLRAAQGELTWGAEVGRTARSLLQRRLVEEPSHGE